MKTTEAELLALVAEEALVDPGMLQRDAALGDLGISSLDLITLLFELEERFGVVIEEGDMPKFATLGELIDFLMARINGQEVGA